MNTLVTHLCRIRSRFGLSAALLTGGLALLPLAAQAQFNRSGPYQEQNSLFSNPLQSRPAFQTSPMATPGYFGQGQMNMALFFNRSLAPGMRSSVMGPGMTWGNNGGVWSMRQFVPSPQQSMEDYVRLVNSPSQLALSGPSPSRQALGAPFTFQRGQAGFNFRFRNGVFGRSRRTFFGWGNWFFPGGFAFYPFYSPFWIDNLTWFSPYYFYGIFPPYIALSSVYFQPPQFIYVPVPIYIDGQYRGSKRDDMDDYYLNREPKQKDEPKKKDSDGQPGDENKEGDNRDGNSKDGQDQSGQYHIGEGDAQKASPIVSAVTDIKQAWQGRDIQLLAKHIRSEVRIAVYLRGKYQYSLDASDYLDITRDAFSTTKTVQFALDKVQRKQKDVYTVSGRHIYKDKDGDEHTVHVSYVLEKMDDEYIITQVGSAPDQIEE
jgi:hypothetical protein